MRKKDEAVDSWCSVKTPKERKEQKKGKRKMKVERRRKEGTKAR